MDNATGQSGVSPPGEATAGLRIAIVGYGAVADIHARTLAACSGVTLAAVIGPRRDRALAFAERHGITQVFDALPRALQDMQQRKQPRPDAVIIASPTELHVEQAEQAIEAGVHALVEFPFVAESARLRRLFDCARAEDRVLAVAHTSRFIWSFTHARSILESRLLGNIKAVRYTRLMQRPPGTGAAGAARTWTDDVLIHHGGHALDLLRYWFGAGIDLVGAVCPPESHGRRNVGFLLRGPDGCPVTVSLSYDADAPCLSVHVTGERGDMQIDGFVHLRVRGTVEWESRPGDDEVAYHDAIRRQDEAFLAAARGQSGFPVTPEETMALNELTGRAETMVGQHHGR